MPACSRKNFQRTILDWHQKNGRHDLPWRKTRDPYHILVSEIMLQQTQVSRALQKYGNFLKRFPTMSELANTDVKDVLKEWQGLGYNRRALYLKRTAETILDRFQGRFPMDICVLETLPGIGTYTARAVSVFAWNRPEIVLDTNIRRVYLYFFFKNKKQVPDSEIMQCIAGTMPSRNPREWYSALMDYGAQAFFYKSNPNVRSKSYARQSPFKGSRRYARAKALQYVLKQNVPVPLKELQNHFKSDPFLHPYTGQHVLRDVLHSLEKEGFLKMYLDKWGIDTISLETSMINPAL